MLWLQWRVDRRSHSHSDCENASCNAPPDERAPGFETHTHTRSPRRLHHRSALWPQISRKNTNNGQCPEQQLDRSGLFLSKYWILLTYWPMRANLQFTCRSASRCRTHHLLHTVSRTRCRMEADRWDCGSAVSAAAVVVVSGHCRSHSSARRIDLIEQINSKIFYHGFKIELSYLIWSICEDRVKNEIMWLYEDRCVVHIAFPEPSSPAAYTCSRSRMVVSYKTCCKQLKFY